MVSLHNTRIVTKAETISKKKEKETRHARIYDSSCLKSRIVKFDHELTAVMFIHTRPALD